LTRSPVRFSATGSFCILSLRNISLLFLPHRDRSRRRLERGKLLCELLNRQLYVRDWNAVQVCLGRFSIADGRLRDSISQFLLFRIGGLLGLLLLVVLYSRLEASKGRRECVYDFGWLWLGGLSRCEDRGERFGCSNHRDRGHH
jgi:hypothetical protein